MKDEQWRRPSSLEHASEILLACLLITWLLNLVSLLIYPSNDLHLKGSDVHWLTKVHRAFTAVAKSMFALRRLM